MPYVSNAAGGGPAPCVIVVGQGQKRVEKAARKLGASTILKDWPAALKFSPYIPEKHEAISVEFNRKWINQKMDEGCTIHDIGPDTSRPPSPFYDAEIEEIEKRKYPRLRTTMK